MTKSILIHRIVIAVLSASQCSGSPQSSRVLSLVQKVVTALYPMWDYLWFSWLEFANDLVNADRVKTEINKVLLSWLASFIFAVPIATDGVCCATHVNPPLQTVMRYNGREHRRIPITCPKAVKSYNQFMGGTDKNDYPAFNDVDDTNVGLE